MMWFVNAIDKGAESNDNLTKARTLVAQSTIYYLDIYCRVTHLKSTQSPMFAKALGTVAFGTTPPYRIAMHYAEILPTDYHFLTTKFGKFVGGG
jgi:hypothetical protein